MGYRMPAEWEPHEATWLGWPHERTDWPGKFAPIPWVYAEIVRHLARVERVRILVEGKDAEAGARRVLQKSGVNLAAVEFFRIPTNRGWTRDSGPIFVKNAAGEIAITHWKFNAWAKYDDYQKDAAFVTHANRRLKLPLWQPAAEWQQQSTPQRKTPPQRIVLEGGSIDVNGRGTLLTTEECLLSPIQARNPGMSRDQIETVLRDYLGATNVLWLRNGIAGDDTHGHVDDLARFVDPSTVVTVIEQDPAEANYAPLQENLALLKEMKDQSGHPLRIETLPMPEPVFFVGQRLPASYANFYIANRIVLVPTFSDANDRVALSTLASLFPDRQIIPIPCRDLVLGLGTIHCMTQQQPAAGSVAL
ncbi:MAG: agmatine deiminase family protein [Candidatus Acidiferrales bacterium]